jgi:hypothetical protein
MHTEGDPHAIFLSPQGLQTTPMLWAIARNDPRAHVGGARTRKYSSAIAAKLFVIQVTMAVYQQFAYPNI